MLTPVAACVCCSSGWRSSRAALRPGHYRALLLLFGLLLLISQQHGAHGAHAAHAADAQATHKLPHPAGAAGSSSNSSSSSSKLDLRAKANKPVIVVLGTAGSGTRTVHQILAAAGVWMHPRTNPEFDSLLFIRKIKHTPPFGMPGRRSGMVWETRGCPAYYNASRLSRGVRTALADAHQRVAAEMLRDVPDDAPLWAWKEPQAIYTLPFLVRAFPNLHIIHQTRDGRDVAMSNLNSTSRRTTRPYQRHYIKAITGAEFNASELVMPAFSVAAGATWAAVNANARAWAAEHGLGLQGRYSLTRLEDLCGGSGPGGLRATISTLLANAGVPHDGRVLDRAAAVINATKCQTARWQAAWASNDTRLAAAIRTVDAEAAHVLEAFNYQPASTGSAVGVGSGQMAASADGSLQQQLRAQLAELGVLPTAATAAAGGAAAPPLVVAFVPPGLEHDTLGSWLQQAHVARARVLLAVEGGIGSSSSSSIQGVRAATQAAAAHNGSPPALVIALPVSQDYSSSSQQPTLARLHLLHLLAASGQRVLLSHAASVWRADVLAHLQSEAAAYDIVAPPAALPAAPSALLGMRGNPAGDLGVLRVLSGGMTAAAGPGGDNEVSLLFINATQAATALLRGMIHQLLQEQQHQGLVQDVRGSACGEQQQQQQVGRRALLSGQSLAQPHWQRRWREQPGGILGLLRDQLLLANLAFSRVPPHDGAPPGQLQGVQATTAPGRLSVLFLSQQQVPAGRQGAAAAPCDQGLTEHAFVAAPCV